MDNYKFTEEAEKLFDYIKKVLFKEYPTNKILTEHFILAILKNHECNAYKLLNKVMMKISMDGMINWYDAHLRKWNDKDGNSDELEDSFDIYFKDIVSTKNDEYPIGTSDLLISIIKNNEKVKKSFNISGVTFSEIFDINEKNYKNPKNKSYKKDSEIKPKTQKKKNSRPHSLINVTETVDNEVERNLKNINKISENGNVNKIIGNEKLYEQIFNIFLKKNKNNVILVGDSGVGKTSIVKNIANLINDKKVPRPFIGKKLMEMNFSELITNTSFKGMFEAKLKSIVDDASRYGNYIFFIDDIESILSEYSRIGDINTDKLLDSILSNNNILCIATTNHKSYNRIILKNPILKRRFNKLTINEPDDTLMHSIIDYHSKLLSEFHNVYFDEECIDGSIKLCKRYENDMKLPDSCIDILDQTAAYKTMNRKINESIIDNENELDEVRHKKESLLNGIFDGDEYDELTKKELDLKSNISKLEKEELFSQNPIEVTLSDIKTVLSGKIGIPITEINEEERFILSGINDRIKNTVIGQDNAVDILCKSVKRNRIGLSSPNKPIVFLFAGSTGTGKTYLAKTLAKELFGDENKMVRIDMSEYMDKISANKLYGTSAGYIGYDNGGILTNAVKKNKHCVLLLDEIEKAHDSVHNSFLQLFDEGRMTDNTGEVVDFKNVIIIMTSNIGVKESIERGNQIGFNKNRNFSNEIIKNELKKKFKPEFINRIDNIIYFNKLNENNIKNIIRLEMEKLENRVISIGYKFNENMKGNDIVDYIYGKIPDMELGARPILRVIQNNIEDKMTEYIIDNNVEKGFEFESKLFL